MIDIIVLLPKDRCTKIQQLQMTTVKDANVHNFVGMKVKIEKYRLIYYIIKIEAKLDI